MEKIDFHFNVGDRLGYVCAVAKKMGTLGKRMAVWSTDRARLDALDRLLWTREPRSFLAHSRAGDPAEAHAPIVLSESLPNLKADVLVLLDDDLPEDWGTEFGRFERIIDVVGDEEAERAASRVRWRAYKAASVKVDAFDRKR